YRRRIPYEPRNHSIPGSCRPAGRTRSQAGEGESCRGMKSVRSPGLDRDDDALLGALREGDERVFTDLVDRWSQMMLRLALSRVESRAVAEEVVQDAWLTVLRSLDRYEGRSTFRTWVLGIVVNLARSRARAERRAVPLSSESAPSVDPA